MVYILNRWCLMLVHKTGCLFLDSGELKATAVCFGGNVQPLF
jgi:hypothetical protein